MKQNLFGKRPEEIAALTAKYVGQAYRAKQIAEWIYKKHVWNFNEMTNLPLAQRQLLDAHFEIFCVNLKARIDSKDGKTTKFLLEFHDGIAVESVLMRQPYGNSICVSTQAGCAMGCTFCASTLHGMVRNLTSAEILAQVAFLDCHLAVENEKVDTIVLMGSGEPLANYDAVLEFIRLCHAPDLYHMSYRHMTLSTSGIIPMIDRLGGEALPINLSISLHASNDRIRTELMPINRTYGIADVVQAGGAYAAKTGRRVTYEYILIGGVNDKVEHAEELANLLHGQLAAVNLIPINSIEERGLRRPGTEAIRKFCEVLDKRRIASTVRKEMGSDIQAACGQLRNRHLNQD